MCSELLTSIQGLTIIALVVELLVIISIDMPTFRLVVAMVVELIILIHNTLLGEIMISSTRTRLMKIYSPVGNIFSHAKIQLQRFYFIELRFFRRRR